MEVTDCKNKELLKGNKKYLEKKCHDKDLTEEATRHDILITCIDARIDPLALGHFKVGQTYVMRNAGGRATDDMIRSAVLAIRFFKADTIYLVQHTDCGMEKVDDPEVRKLLGQNLGPAHLHDHHVEKHNRDKYRQSDYVAFLAFKDLRESITDDVYRLRSNKLISEKVHILGYMLDVKTGKLELVAKSPGK